MLVVELQFTVTFPRLTYAKPIPAVLVPHTQLVITKRISDFIALSNRVPTSHMVRLAT